MTKRWPSGRTARRPNAPSARHRLRVAAVDRLQVDAVRPLLFGRRDQEPPAVRQEPRAAGKYDAIGPRRQRPRLPHAGRQQHQPIAGDRRREHPLLVGRQRQRHAVAKPHRRRAVGRAQVDRAGRAAALPRLLEHDRRAVGATDPRRSTRRARTDRVRWRCRGRAPSRRRPTRRASPGRGRRPTTSCSVSVAGADSSSRSCPARLTAWIAWAAPRARAGEPDLLGRPAPRPGRARCSSPTTACVACPSRSTSTISPAVSPDTGCERMATASPAGETRIWVMWPGLGS